VEEVSKYVINTFQKPKNRIVQKLKTLYNH